MNMIITVYYANLPRKPLALDRKFNLAKKM